MNCDQKEILARLKAEHPALCKLIPQVEEAFALLKSAYDAGGKVMICGNGGSAADSEHIVGELMKGFLKKRPIKGAQRAAFDALDGLPADFADKLQGALPAIALPCHTSLTSAYSNDVAADMIFAQQVFGYGKPGDVLIALSTSGNSKNVVNAVWAAKAARVKTIAITGEKESALSELCDVCLRTPSHETYRVQEYTLPLYHALCALIEAEYFAE